MTPIEAAAREFRAWISDRLSDTFVIPSKDRALQDIQEELLAILAKHVPPPASEPAAKPDFSTIRCPNCDSMMERDGMCASCSHDERGHCECSFCNSQSAAEEAREVASDLVASESDRKLVADWCESHCDSFTVAAAMKRLLKSSEPAASVERPTCEVCGDKGYVFASDGKGYPCPAECDQPKRVDELERKLAEAERRYGELEAHRDALQKLLLPVDQVKHPAVEMQSSIRAKVRTLCELAESQLQREWQPIETAPKDGTRVIGYWGEGQRFIGEMRWTYNGFDTGWMISHLGLVKVKPTHWQSFPKPPDSRA